LSMNCFKANVSQIGIIQKQKQNNEQIFYFNFFFEL
jgi:hypothetical protein